MEPDCARAAMAMGRPAIETGDPGAVAEAAAAPGIAAVLVATMPKFGRFAAAALTALVAFCAFGAVFEVPAAALSRCAARKFAAGEVPASPGDGVAGVVAGC